MTETSSWISEEGTSGLVSVIIPTYNRAAYLPATIDSVEQSSYRPLQIVLVDDGSTDQTPELAAGWRQSFSGADGLEFACVGQSHSGAAAARNTGLRHSVGEFIHFLDSDDLVARERYRIQVACLADDQECDFVWAGWYSTPDEGVEGALQQLNRRLFERMAGDRVADAPNGPLSGLFRRRACARLGPWAEGYCCNEDWEYMFRFLCREPVIRQLPCTQTVYRVHTPGRVSARTALPEGLKDKLRMASVLEPRMPLTGPFRDTLARRLAECYYSAALTAIRVGGPALRATALRGLRRQTGPWLGPAFRRRARILPLLHALCGDRLTLALHGICGWVKRR